MDKYVVMLEGSTTGDDGICYRPAGTPFVGSLQHAYDLVRDLGSYNRNGRGKFIIYKLVEAT